MITLLNMESSAYGKKDLKKDFFLLNYRKHPRLDEATHIPETSCDRRHFNELSTRQIKSQPSPKLQVNVQCDKQPSFSRIPLGEYAGCHGRPTLTAACC